MDPQTKTTQDIFDNILKGAVEDLRESGLGDRDVFLIVKDQFGPQNAHRFCSVIVDGGEAIKGGVDGQSG